MAIRAAVATVGTGASQTASTPGATLNAGEYAGLWVVTDDFTKAPTPSGMTQQADASISTPDGQSARLYDKIATGSEGTGIAVTGLATGNTVMIMFALTGRNTSAPRTFTPHVATKTTSTASPAAISDTVTGTAAAGDDTGMVAMMDTNGVVGAGWVFTSTAGGMTIRVSQTDAWTPAGLMTKDGVTAGAIGTVTMTGTNSGGSGGWGSVVFSIAQASGTTVVVLDERRLFARASGARSSMVSVPRDIHPPSAAAPALGVSVDFDGPRRRSPAGIELPLGRLDAVPPLLQLLALPLFDGPRAPSFPVARTPPGRADAVPPLLALLSLPMFDGPKTPNFPSTLVSLGRPEPLPPLLGLLAFQVFDVPPAPKYVPTILQAGRLDAVPALLPLPPLVLEAREFAAFPRRVPAPSSDAAPPVQVQAPTPLALADDREFVRLLPTRPQRPDEGLARLLGSLPALDEQRGRTPAMKGLAPLTAPPVLPAITVQAAPVALLEDRLRPPRAPRQPALPDAPVLPAVPPLPFLADPQEPRQLPAQRAPMRPEETPAPLAAPAAPVLAPDDRAFARPPARAARARSEEWLPSAPALFALLGQQPGFVRPRQSAPSVRFETVLPPIPPPALLTWFQIDSRRAAIWVRHRFNVVRFDEGVPILVSYVAAAPDRSAALNARPRRAALQARPAPAMLRSESRRGSLH
jgi:hypothetical protein